MQQQISELGSGITCIDAGYIRPGIACFYLLEQDGECAIIETGTNHSVPALLDLMAAREITPEQVRYVIPTHVHLDHAGGAGSMMSHFPRAQLLVHPRGSAHLIDPGRLVAASMLVYGERQFRELYGEIVAVDAARVIDVEDGDTVELGGRTLEFRHTRGHADHHMCVWDKLTRGWFSGDMFGVSYGWFRRQGGDYVMPATTPTQFRPDDFIQSLALLDSYRPDIMYLTHFGGLGYSVEVYQMLLEQVSAYPGLARSLGIGETLEQAIISLSLDRVRRLDESVTDEQGETFFGMDARLNVQGLAAWLQRESARAGG